MGFFSDITGAIGDAIGIAAAPETGGLSLAALAPSLISGGATLLGGMNTNSANAAMVSQQEQFQADMSGTAYQRATQDMIKAGLNPMLAYSNGPASSPTGSTMQMQNPYPAAVTSAVDAADMRQKNANVALTQAQTASALATLPEKKVGGDIWGAIEPIVKKVSASASSSDNQSKILDVFDSGRNAVGDYLSDPLKGTGLRNRGSDYQYDSSPNLGF